MSKKLWQVKLSEVVKRLQKPGMSTRIAVIGIGNELRGDDAAGLRLVGILKSLVAKNGNLLVIEAGPAPESFSGTLRRFQPDLVLLIDAADMSLDPGTVQWLSVRDTTGFSASTHSLPLHILADYLITELGCEVALIGIQPTHSDVDTPLTPVVQEATEATAKALAEAFQAL